MGHLIYADVFFGERNKKYIGSKNYIFDQKISVDPRSDIQKF